MSSTPYRKVSLSRIRLPDESDRNRICCQLILAAEKAKDKEVVRDLDIDQAVDALVNREVDAVILDDAYLVSYAIVQPWYKKTYAVVERLVLKLQPGGDFSVVPHYLEDVAAEYGATSISVGGALASKTSGLIRLYQRYGFVVEDSPTLVKGTDYGLPLPRQERL